LERGLEVRNYLEGGRGKEVHFCTPANRSVPIRSTNRFTFLVAGGDDYFAGFGQASQTELYEIARWSAIFASS